jgi:hypothetical protein
MGSPRDRHIGDHDWHSREYVDDWIARDVQRDGQRRPMLQQMLKRAPQPTAISVYSTWVQAMES